MGIKYDPLTPDQKITLRRAAEDAIRAMNSNWGDFRKVATAPVIISLLDNLEEKAAQKQRWNECALKTSEELDAAERHIAELKHQIDRLQKTINGIQPSILQDHARIAELEQRLQQPTPKGFSHQDGVLHALLGSNDVMVSHIEWTDCHGIAFSPVPTGKKEIGVNFDTDIAGKSSAEIGAVFVVKSTSVQSLELLKEAVQMAIDGFKVEGA